MKKLKVAVTGVGWCGCEHIKAFNSLADCEVVALHGRDASRVGQNLRRYGVQGCTARITTHLDAVLSDPEIDIVSIAGVNSTHAQTALAAMRAGKHVMIEKPVALDGAMLAELVSEAQKHRVKSVVSFELYWNPLFRTARWLIESGRLGKVMFVRSNYHSRVDATYPGWNWCRKREEGQSILLAAGCHSVDAVRNFLNDHPKSVSAIATNGLNQGYEYATTLMMNIQFADGLIGQVSVSADVAAPYHFGLEIYGQRLSLVNQFIRWPSGESLDVQTLQHECPVEGVRFIDESKTEKRIRVDCILPDSVDVEHHPFGDEARSLVTAIRENSQTPLSLERAAITHRICYAADASAANDGAVFQVGQDSEEIPA